MACKAHHWLIPTEHAIVEANCKNCKATKTFDNRPRATDIRGVPIDIAMPWSVKQALAAAKEAAE